MFSILFNGDPTERPLLRDRMGWGNYATMAPYFHPFQQRSSNMERRQPGNNENNNNEEQEDEDDEDDTQQHLQQQQQKQQRIAAKAYIHSFGHVIVLENDHPDAFNGCYSSDEEDDNDVDDELLVCELRPQDVKAVFRTARRRMRMTMNQTNNEHRRTVINELDITRIHLTPSICTIITNLLSKHTVPWKRIQFTECFGESVWDMIQSALEHSEITFVRSEEEFTNQRILSQSLISVSGHGSCVCLGGSKSTPLREWNPIDLQIIEYIKKMQAAATTTRTTTKSTTTATTRKPTKRQLELAYIDFSPTVEDILCDLLSHEPWDAVTFNCMQEEEPALSFARSQCNYHDNDDDDNDDHDNDDNDNDDHDNDDHDNDDHDDDDHDNDDDDNDDHDNDDHDDDNDDHDNDDHDNDDHDDDALHGSPTPGVLRNALEHSKQVTVIDKKPFETVAFQNLTTALSSKKVVTKNSKIEWQMESNG